MNEKLFTERKGISPIIASVLLIAFTLSIALLAGPFFTDTIQTGQRDQNQELEDIQQGLDNRPSYESAGYNAEDNRLDLNFKNAGTNEMKGFSVTALGDDNAQKTFNETVEPGELVEVNLSVSEKPEKIRISSTSTPSSTEVNLGEKSLESGSAPSAPSNLQASD